MIRIEVDERSGFCTGVIKAVKKAEGYLAGNESLFSLGELVHNPQEVGRLAEMGLNPLTYEEFDGLQKATVLIRAHGEPPETYKEAEARNINLIDATCPIVKRLQDKIRDCYNGLLGKEGSILIFGKSSHPEVRALVGQTAGKAMVMRHPEELSNAPLKSPVHLFSQTTMNLDDFDRFAETLRKRMVMLDLDPDKELSVNNTVCRQVSSREDYLKEFVSRFDLVFFVSGRQSSNGKALYELCRKVNGNTHFISEPSESDSFSLEGVGSIGICGATSSPAWLLTAVKGRLEDRIVKV